MCLFVCWWAAFHIHTQFFHWIFLDVLAVCFPSLTVSLSNRLKCQIHVIRKNRLGPRGQLECVEVSTWWIQFCSPLHEINTTISRIVFYFHLPKHWWRRFDCVMNWFDFGFIAFKEFLCRRVYFFLHSTFFITAQIVSIQYEAHSGSNHIIQLIKIGVNFPWFISMTKQTWLILAQMPYQIENLTHTHTRTLRNRKKTISRQQHTRIISQCWKQLNFLPKNPLTIGIDWNYSVHK